MADKEKVEKSGQEKGAALQEKKYDGMAEDFSAQTVSREKISKKTKAVVLILLICMLAVIAVAGWNNISPDRLADSVEKNLLGNTQGQGFPSAIIGSKVNNGNIKLWDKNLAYVSDTSFVVINNTAGQVLNRQISYSSPVILTKGNYSLIYNLGGAGFQIDTVGETVFKSDSRDSILSADINTHGMYAVITQTSGYFAKLTVYNADHTQKYAYYFADYYANSVSINENGTLAAVTGVSSKDGTMRSALYVLDFSSDEPRALLEFDDNLLFQVSFMDNGNIAAIGENAAVMLKSNFTDQSVYNYNKLMLTAFDIDMYNGVTLSLSRSGDGHSCNIVYMDKNGETASPLETDLKITSIDQYGNHISALSGDTVYTYKKNAEQVATADAGVDARAICMESENSAYILGISEIRFVNF